MCSSTPLTAIASKIGGDKFGSMTGKVTGESTVTRFVGNGDSVQGRKNKALAYAGRQAAIKTNEEANRVAYAKESATLLGG